MPNEPDQKKPDSDFSGMTCARHPALPVVAPAPPSDLPHLHPSRSLPVPVLFACWGRLTARKPTPHPADPQPTVRGSPARLLPAGEPEGEAPEGADGGRQLNPRGRPVLVAGVACLECSGPIQATANGAGACLTECPGSFGRALARSLGPEGAPRGDVQGIIGARFGNHAQEETALAAFDAAQEEAGVGLVRECEAEGCREEGVEQLASGEWRCTPHGAGPAQEGDAGGDDPLRACAEMLAELVRSDQIPFEEQADEARALLAKAGVEV